MFKEYFNSRATAEAWAAEVGGTVSKNQDGQYEVTWGRSATISVWTPKTGWRAAK